MNPNLRKQEFSFAYIRAVSAAADCQATIYEVDTDSADGQIRGPLGIRHSLYFQAKSSTTATISDDEVRYSLRRKDYDALRQADVPLHILILMLIPPDESDWTSQAESELCLRRCAYWLDLRGQPEAGDRQSVSVRIPRSQVFDPAQLLGLLDRARGGDSA